MMEGASELGHKTSWQKAADHTASNPRGRLFKMLDPQSRVAAALAKRGYAVVTVVSRDRARALEDQVWTDLEALGTGISRSNPATWSNAHWPQTTHGLLQNQQWGLREGTCLARLATRGFWDALFQGKRTISSFDAIAVCRPDSQKRAYNSEIKHQRDKEERTMLSSWLHTDQAKGKRQCMEHIQAAFALTDLGEAEQRTQLVVPQKGEMCQSFRDRFIDAFPPEVTPKGKFDAEREEWIKHTDAERRWLLDNGRVVTPVLRAGQMLLWDSGMPHASVPGPLKDPAATRGVRMSVFVSALPLELLDTADLNVRRRMLEQGDTSGHRVTSKGKRTYRQCKFTKTGRTYNKVIPTYSSDRVVTGFKRAIDANEDSTAAKIARMCGGY